MFAVLNVMTGMRPVQHDLFDLNKTVATCAQGNLIQNPTLVLLQISEVLPIGD